MMKCEKCPLYTLVGLKNDLNWCKLYNAEAPVVDCEYERDTLIKQQELMQGFFEKKQ